jgi:hypothetical protein
MAGAAGYLGIAFHSPRAVVEGCGSGSPSNERQTNPAIARRIANTTAIVKAVLVPPALRAVRMSIKISLQKKCSAASEREKTWRGVQPMVHPHRRWPLNANINCTFPTHLSFSVKSKVENRRTSEGVAIELDRKNSLHLTTPKENLAAGEVFFLD